MTKLENIVIFIESAVKELVDPKTFWDAKIIASQSSNVQNKILVDIERTNQFLVGIILVKLDKLQKTIDLLSSNLQQANLSIDSVNENIITIRDHLKNNQEDTILAQQFKNFNILNDIKSLNKAIESAKSLNKEAIQPDFGWTRRGSVNWLKPAT